MKIGRLDCLDNYPQQLKVKKHHALKSTINLTFVPICFVAEVGIFFCRSRQEKNCDEHLVTCSIHVLVDSKVRPTAGIFII